LPIRMLSSASFAILMHFSWFRSIHERGSAEPGKELDTSFCCRIISIPHFRHWERGMIRKSGLRGKTFYQYERGRERAVGLHIFADNDNGRRSTENGRSPYPLLHGLCIQKARILRIRKMILPSPINAYGRNKLARRTPNRPVRGRLA